MQQRTIKSFVLRAGRVSHRQQYALDHYLADYILSDSTAPWGLSREFGRDADTIVEIGFGMGASLCAQAQAQPHNNYIGIEVHRAGIGSLVADLYDLKLTNVRVVPCDAVEVFQRCVLDDSLSGVQIFFPDPWPKLKHHKRRLIQSAFIRSLVQKIKPGGFLHCATDWQPYAEHIQDVLSAEPALRNQEADGGFSARPETRPITKFEQRGTRLGHGVWDLMYIRR